MIVESQDVLPFFRGVGLIRMPPCNCCFEVIAGQFAMTGRLHEELISPIDQLTVPKPAVLLFIKDQLPAGACPGICGGIKNWSFE